MEFDASLDEAREWEGKRIVDVELLSSNSLIPTTEPNDSLSKMHPARAIFLANAGPMDADSRDCQAPHPGANANERASIEGERDFLISTLTHSQISHRHHSQGSSLYPDCYIPIYTNRARIYSHFGERNSLPRGGQLSATYFGVPDEERALNYIVSAMADMDTRFDGADDRRGDRNRNRGNKRRRDGELQASQHLNGRLTRIL
jgi:hypothetical protein